MGNGAVGWKYDQENNAMSNQLLLERGYQINLMRQPWVKNQTDLSNYHMKIWFFCQTVNFVKTKDSNGFVSEWKANWNAAQLLFIKVDLFVSFSIGY